MLSSASGIIKADTSVTNVFGGRPVLRGEFPYLASTIPNSGIDACSGGIIFKNAIISAAHCVRNDLLREGRIPPNSQFKIGHDKNAPEQIVTICSRYTRTDPFFQYPAESPNDIVILGTCEDINFTDYVKPISITEVVSDYLNIRNPVTLAGYGILTPSNYISVSNIAQTATSTVESRANYNDFLLRYYGVPLLDSYSCNSTISSTTDSVATVGDSGSPVLNQEGIAIGINSFGTGLQPQNSYFSCYYDLRSQSTNDWVSNTIAEIERNPGVRQPSSLMTYSVNVSKLPVIWVSDNYISNDLIANAQIRLGTAGDPNIIKGDINLNVNKNRNCYDYSVIKSEMVDLVENQSSLTITSRPTFNFRSTTNPAFMDLLKIKLTFNKTCTPLLFDRNYDYISLGADSNSPLIKYSSIDNPYTDFLRVPPKIATGINTNRTLYFYKALEVPSDISVGGYFTYSEGSKMITATRVSPNQLSIYRTNYTSSSFLINRDNKTATSVPEAPGGSTITVTYNFYDYRSYIPNISFTTPITQ